MKDTRISSEEVDDVCGLHSVIVTASPVLTNEIRRFYTNLRNKIIGELKKREERKKAREQEAEKKKDS